MMRLRETTRTGRGTGLGLPGSPEPQSHHILLAFLVLSFLFFLLSLLFTLCRPRRLSSPEFVPFFLPSVVIATFIAHLFRFLSFFLFAILFCAVLCCVALSFRVFLANSIFWCFNNFWYFETHLNLMLITCAHVTVISHRTAFWWCFC